MDPVPPHPHQEINSLVSGAVHMFSSLCQAFQKPATTVNYFYAELFFICKMEINICKEDIPTQDLSS